MTYDLRTPRAPRLAGMPLELVARLARSWLGGVVYSALASNVGLPGFRRSSAGDAPLAPLPLLPPRVPHPEVTAPDLDALADAKANAPGFAFETVADLRRAYRAGETDPVEVADRAIAAIADADARSPPLRMFIAHDAGDVIEQARASRARWQRGALLGPLDGVPVAIKDEVHQRGYPTTLGTAFRARVLGAVSEDSAVVARLRAAGAVLLGKANMTEIGINPIGHQRHRDTAQPVRRAALYRRVVLGVRAQRRRRGVPHRPRRRRRWLHTQPGQLLRRGGSEGHLRPHQRARCPWAVLERGSPGPAGVHGARLRSGLRASGRARRPRSPDLSPAAS